MASNGAQPQTRRAAPMAVWNALGWFAALVTGFVITRLIVEETGEHAYGIWATIGAIRGFVLFVDGGIAFTVSRDAALLDADGDPDAAPRVRAARRVYAGLAVLALTVYAVAAGLPALLLGLDVADAETAGSVTLVLGVEVAAALVTSPLAATLRGRQRFDALAAVNWSYALLAVGLVAALAPGHGLLGAAAAVAGARALVFVGAWAWTSRKGLLPAPGGTPGTAVREVLTFAAPLWLAAVGTQLGAGTDIPIVGGFHGAESAGHYAMGALLPGAGAGLLFAITGSYFPRMVSAEQRDARRLVGTLLYMATTLAFCGFGFIALHRDALLFVWVDRAPELASMVVFISCIGWCLNAPTNVLSNLAIARGVHRIVGPIVLAEATVNVLLSAYLAYTWSAAGPAFGTLGTLFVSNVLVMPTVLRRRLGISWSEIVRPSCLGALTGVLAAASVYGVTWSVGGPALVTVGVGVATTLLVAGAILDLTVRGESDIMRVCKITWRGGWSVLSRQKRELREQKAHLERVRRESPIVWTKSPSPLVTVRIATYNRGQLVADRAIASALAQTYENIEVLVVGDCCDDATAQAVLSVKDPRVKFVNLPERGRYPSDAELRWMVAGATPMNHAYDIARGEWIACLDDDDEFTPDHVEALLDACRTNDWEFVYGKAAMEQRDGTWTECGAWPPRPGRIVHAAVMFWSQIATRHDLQSWRIDEPVDWNLWHRMRDSGVRMGFLDQIVTKHYAERRGLPEDRPFYQGRP